MISAIVAVDKNWGIGYHGQLLEYIPEDMKHFKKLTTGHVVIMGRKTWDSLPNKPLSNRKHIIITHDINSLAIDSEVSFGCTLEELLKSGLTEFKEDVFIIGGGSIYEQLLPLCDRVYVTFIEKKYENVDTYFPNLNKIKGWEISYCTALRDYNGIGYAFAAYDRKS